MRASTIERKTAETDISVNINLDGEGTAQIDTGCGFLDHMLTLFAKHAGVDLVVACRGDVRVDYHHTVEDIGISLGAAIREALGEKRGIERYGDITLPMDETLILAALDISGRPYYVSNLDIKPYKVGDFDVELVDEFFRALVMNAGITLHINQLAGKNAHHIIEGTFKAFARAFAKAARVVDGKCDIPSTKGVL